MFFLKKKNISYIYIYIMGGGLMQLVAYGAQDVYLTGNPQITFFKVVYRRHTNFSMESIKQNSKGSDEDKTWNITRSGDLIYSMFIEWSWKSPAATERKFKGTDVVKHLNQYNGFFDKIKYNCEIGGQIVDKFDGYWRRIYNSLYDLNPTSDDNTLSSYMEKRGNFNLPFWFCRNPGLALPLIALQYHEVNINMHINDTTKKDAYCNSPSLWVDYIYLDTDERRRFAQVSHEYLIEQVQKQTFNVDNSTQNFNLHFNHPVKELQWIFVAKDEDLDSFCEPVLSETTLVGGDVDNCNVILKLNGQDRFQEQKLGFFADYQKYKYHTGTGNLCNLDGDLDLNISTLEYVIQNMKDGDNSTKLGHTQLASSMGSVGGKSPDDHPNKVNDDMITEITGAISKSAKCPVYTYSFALKPEEHQPSGTCNFSRIDSSSLNFSGMNGAATAKQNIKLFVYAVNYNVLRVMSGMGGLAYSN
jgi:hypothetical protein